MRPVDLKGASPATLPSSLECDLTAMCLVITAPVVAMSAAGPALLDAHETARLADFVSVDAERRFVAGACLLRLVVARLTGQHPAAVEVDRRCLECGRNHGKTRIGDGDLQVSVSHSGDAVQVACTRSAPVGVDIQARGSRVTPAMRVLLGRERDRQMTTEAFLITWTRIEAVVKATGEGLRVPLEAVRVSSPQDPPRLESYRGEPLKCQMHAQRQLTGFVGSVAVLSDSALEFVELSARDFLGARHTDQ
ncbi:4'-phosphopantetheinyl transferase [Tessaracoccus bendigoensis DSM 12906]|uniref:4'-phosphopantetheinyl transferase n=1 Tax=Tessaracoccus bendigoensis DSM 12906 TaxID=1123357 RepID=A0A1M6LMV0_9ACTN|nr:4'-phosphopantetheinyl transferase superfamily protein [Tessaracoccus bendigoensis]SHJ72485.1 4'-phosphopantetheinyl transferase [Tessaracoccus bendigoensis DSM 12906]